MSVDAPARPLRIPADVHRDDDALPTEAIRARRDQLRLTDGGGVDRYLLGTGFQERPHVFDRADAAADRQGDEDLGSGTLHDVDHRLARIRARGDVEKDQLVGSSSL